MVFPSTGAVEVATFFLSLRFGALKSGIVPARATKMIQASSFFMFCYSGFKRLGLFTGFMGYVEILLIGVG